MTQPLIPQDPYPSMRDEKGRFVPGSPGGPGRKRKRDEYLEALQEAVTPDGLMALATKMYADALDGIEHARTLIFRYLLPAPSRTDDGDPLGYVALLTAEQHALMRAQVKEELRREMQAEQAPARFTPTDEKMRELEQKWAEHSFSSARLSSYSSAIRAANPRSSG